MGTSYSMLCRASGMHTQCLRNVLQLAGWDGAIGLRRALCEMRDTAWLRLGG